jgi:Asp-tRNA(Asn)/Glu-tRNA(Gln) amidotransferase A subunit family amidase
MTALHDLTLAQQSQQLAAGQTTSVALTQHALSRIEAHTELGAFLHVDATGALLAAAAADARRAAGQSLGSLDGLPIAHKDIFVTEGLPTTAASRILKGYMSPFDATVVAQLKAAGVVNVGKLNCDEFAMGGANENSAYAKARNPWDTIGWFSRGRGRTFGVRHNRHRHGRLDPSTGCPDRHHRHQANVWPLLALRHDRLCLVTRPGWPDGPHGRRLRHAAASHERLRCA